MRLMRWLYRLLPEFNVDGWCSTRHWRSRDGSR